MHEGLSRRLTAPARALSRMGRPRHAFRIFDRCGSHVRQLPHRAQPVLANRIRGPPPPSRSRDGVRNDAGPEVAPTGPTKARTSGTPPAREAEKGHVHVIPYTTSRFALMGMPSEHFRPYPNPKSYP
jgi:hypothetical protein